MSAQMGPLGSWDRYQEGPFDKSLAIAGGLVGALAGAFLWGVIGKITHGERRYFSFVIGAMAGLGVLMMGGGRGQVPSILGGVFAASGLILGKVLMSLWYLSAEGYTGAMMIRYHTFIVDFVFLIVAVAVGVFIPGSDKTRAMVNVIRQRLPARFR